VQLMLRALAENNLANDVAVVRDGAEALDYLYRRGSYADLSPGPLPVVMLLDLKMPGVDGLEVLKQIKSDSQLKMLPVVMVTSSREERDLVESYNLGVNAFVVKPTSFDQFAIVIKQLGLFWTILNEPPLGHRKKMV
jgi:CheY-like chemotaxis protein